MSSPSVLAEMMKQDGSSTIPVLGSESLSAELAHDLMAIQVSRLTRVTIYFVRVQITQINGISVIKLVFLGFLFPLLYCVTLGRH